MSSPVLGAFVIESSPVENLPLLGALIAAWMYWHGGRSFRAACRQGTIEARRIGVERWRSISFALGLVVLVLALQEPLDGYADTLFWAHMVQHVLLLAVVPPLILLGVPWMRMWRALPLSWRRPSARWAVHAPSASPLRTLSHVLGRPKVAWVLISADIVLWHIPAAYDLTLRSDVVHYTEHASYLLLALLAWGQVIDSPPYRSALDPPRRAMFAVAVLLPGWVLALLLAFSRTPWYSGYADLAHRPGGISALTDQHLAAGVMWVPAALPWALAVFIWLFKWIAEPRFRPKAGAIVTGDGEVSPTAPGAGSATPVRSSAPPRRPAAPSRQPAAQPGRPAAPSRQPAVPSRQPASAQAARERVLVAVTTRRPHA